ncbi:NUDIX domain-containing protein [uncultured Halopseudomonas sp.]|uniref:NUDIX hydrolase n=1 Tax=uncultured Halopseudomonas sp. TaxID=2901193 RepID=UPI0030EE20E7
MDPRDRAHLAASAAEQVIHVDENDQPLGVTARGGMHAKGLIPRCTFILVYNSGGELCIHRRSPCKRLYPGFWDVAAGGVVAAGETYRQSAERELGEELGIVGVELQRHFRFFYQSEQSRLWGCVFSCTWDGPIIMQPEEVVAVRWINPGKAWQRDGESYAPDSLQALELQLAGYVND